MLYNHVGVALDRLINNGQPAELAALETELTDLLDRVQARRSGMPEPVSPEPDLREHVAQFHPRLRVHGTSEKLLLAREHGREHFQFGSATHHHGPNAGPHSRPRGWRDGSGVVLIDRKGAMRRKRDKQEG
jgi:hypothetical protein